MSGVGLGAGVRISLEITCFWWLLVELYDLKGTVARRNNTRLMTEFFFMIVYVDKVANYGQNIFPA